ncbi:HupE/UreJ family protein [Paenibacillus sp. KQZ6P-2]|uniref:HupE/UreJ family protein n=1 Tax=Paenibacillus mangrovi TaxID=2931978 RepID=A0A9X1WRM1_9BACL|nr:HupE/UreJ family protein [Paenibacillus mangrovi]MCJ8013436.1 HupE/UreJ family protein [Paenibacillus mangrovi]
MSIFSIMFMYINLGLEHIITGYDHLLFLLALIIISKKFTDVLKIITAFTIAHSITLTLAALELIPVFPKWIEAGIALTIAYVAMENFFVKTSKWRWALTFAFGLIHGLGFATAISEIGFDQTYTALSLLSFNVGIEVGQLLVVALVLPFLLKLQSNEKYYRPFFYSTSACIFAVATIWFFQRLFV